MSVMEIHARSMEREKSLTQALPNTNFKKLILNAGVFNRGGKKTFLNAWWVLDKHKPRSAMTSLGRFSRRGLRGEGGSVHCGQGESFSPCHHHVLSEQQSDAVNLKALYGQVLSTVY